MGYNLPKDMYGTFQTGQPNFSAFGTLGVEGSYIAHDIFVDGSLFHDNLHTTTKNPLRGAMNASVTFRYKNMQLSYQHTFDTKIFKEQNEPDQWGSIFLSINAKF